MSTTHTILRYSIFASILISSFALFAQNKDNGPGKARGQITGNYQDDNQEIYDPLMGEYQISYAIWSLVGEPIWDFKFYWEMYDYYKYCCISDGHYSREISYNDLKKYPDLWKRFESITPLPDIKIQADIAFYSKEFPTTHYRWDKYFVAGKIDFTVDLATKAFDKNIFSVPGSPDWMEVYQPKNCLSNKAEQYILKKINEKFNTNYTWYDITQLFGFFDATYINSKTEKEKDEYKSILDELNKLLYAMSDSIVIKTPEIKEIRWPDTEIKAIFQEYWDRENGEEPDIEVVFEKESKKQIPKHNKDDFWGETMLDNEYFAFQQDHKWGFKNKQGVIKIPAKYDEAWDFNEGVGAVKLDGKWGLINSRQKIIIPFLFNEIKYSGKEINAYYNGPHFREELHSERFGLYQGIAVYPNINNTYSIDGKLLDSDFSELTYKCKCYDHSSGITATLTYRNDTYEKKKERERKAEEYSRAKKAARAECKSRINSFFSSDINMINKYKENKNTTGLIQYLNKHLPDRSIHWKF